MCAVSGTPGSARGTVVTRAMLGWGVAAGPFYVMLALALALMTPGFDLGRDALSLLLLGEHSWAQSANFILSALMVLSGAIGMLRTPGFPNVAALLVAVFGLTPVLAVIFPPDATLNFPPGGSAAEQVTMSGMLHLLVGALGFISMAAAAFIAAPWLGEWSPPAEHWSRGASVTILITFAFGAAFAAGPLGVSLLWITVLVVWAWLAAAATIAYRSHPRPIFVRP